MKSALIILASLASAAMLAGCASTVDANKWAESYYNQANTAEILHVEGTNVSITLSGATKLVLSTPVLPKQMMPRDTTWLDSLMDGVKTVAPWVAVGYLGTHGSYTPTPSYRGPVTINPTPTPTPTP